MSISKSIIPSFMKINLADRNKFIEYAGIAFICLVFFLMIWYIIHLASLQSKECSHMEAIYSSLDTHLKSISPNNPDFSGNFCEYYVKTAYNCCSGGSYKNDYVNICNLKSVLKQGCRGLDFEIYSIDDEPVVATSTLLNNYVKETYNYVNFAEAMKVIVNYAFSGSTAPNPRDPIIIHLRIMSSNQKIYTKMYNIFKEYDNYMLSSDYSYENQKKNLGSVPLLDLRGKIVVIVDTINTAFKDSPNFQEYVNMTSNSVFMRALHYHDIAYSPDLNELREFNKRNMTISMPDVAADPPNPSGILVRDAGCQLVAMRYQLVDSNLEENTAFFDKSGYAFVLKPAKLRYIPVTIPKPTSQNPALSYKPVTIPTVVPGKTITF